RSTRLQGRALDQKACCHADLSRVWRAIPSGTREQAAQGSGLEFAETREESEPARRGCHRAVGQGKVAGDKKRAIEEGRTLLFVDESGFYLLPAVVRTYAPMGETPLLRSKLSHDHLSVIGAVSFGGKLYFQAHEHAIKSAE